MIYIAKHKETQVLEQDWYVPLNMWELKEEDNLFKYNKSLNELVAHYHVWKYENDDIKGIVQYRKYIIDDKTNKPITQKRVSELLCEYDFITTNRYIVGNGIINNLRNEIGGKEQIKLLNKYYNKLVNIEPKLKVYFNQSYFNPGNMFICKREISDSYCDWLFKIITPLYIEYNNDKNKEYKPRLLGYLFERLLTYWLQENKIKVKELNYKTIADRI